LGVVDSGAFYEGIRNLCRSKNVRDYNRYFKKPAGYSYTPTPGEILFRILMGYDVPVTPQMDHAGFLELFEHVKASDELFAQFSRESVIKVAQFAQQVQAMMEALQAQAAQAANVGQQQANAATSQMQAPTGLNPMAGGGMSGAA
jgi:hypothetical protein